MGLALAEVVCGEVESERVQFLGNPIAEIGPRCSCR
jgi:hypothetical protein